MKGNYICSTDLATLRQEAEKQLQNNLLASNICPSEADLLKLIHELKVHQIELEMQNEELILAEKFANNAIKLYDLAPSGYFTLSAEGDILNLNHCGSQMLGKDGSRLINSRFGFFISEDTKPIYNLFLDKVFNSKVKEICEVTLSASDNRPMHVQLTGKTSDDDAQCFVVVADITERKKVEETLRENEVELLRINTEKDKFFSIIAHDLRSPFNGFLGLTEIMVEGLPGMTRDEIHQMAVLIRKSAANLFSLLGNLLEWSRMQRGLTDFAPSSFLLMSKISENMVLVKDAADKKEILISYAVPNLMVFADANMLGGILRNLVTNAVKFTHKGGVILISARSVTGNSVEISVSDTGIGMSKNLIENLFHLGVNTGRKGTEGEYSTGLGLMICKDFIEKSGGKLDIESEEGKGSDFKFTVPMNSNAQ